MRQFLADEGFDARIVAGVRARVAEVDIVTVQAAGLTAWPDPDVLEWAAPRGLVVLTHDVTTMRPAAERRIAANLRMPGVVMIEWDRAIGRAIEDLEVLIGGSRDDEWENSVLFLNWT